MASIGASVTYYVSMRKLAIRLLIFGSHSLAFLRVLLFTRLNLST